MCDNRSFSMLGEKLVAYSVLGNECCGEARYWSIGARACDVYPRVEERSITSSVAQRLRAVCLLYDYIVN
jgi:hypothetical protein